MQKNNLVYVYCFGGHPNNQLISKHLGARFSELPAIRWKFPLVNSFFRAQFLYVLVGAFIKALFKKKQNGVIYFCEGGATIIFPTLMRLLKKERSIVISRMNDTSFDSNKRGFLSSLYHGFLFNNLDGVIGITPMVADDARKLVKCPVDSAVFAPWRGVDYFKKVKPDLNSLSFVFVGEFRQHKGVDILAKTMKLLKKKVNFNFKVYFVGSGIKKNLKRLGLLDDSFIFVGVADPTTIFSKCTFFIHTARYDAGPTAVVEAIASGLIPIVTSKVGAQYIVKKINKDLVIDSLDPRVISSHIASVLSKFDSIQLKGFSNRGRQIMQKNGFDKSMKEYKKIFFRMVSQYKNRSEVSDC